MIHNFLGHSSIGQTLKITYFIPFFLRPHIYILALFIQNFRVIVLRCVRLILEREIVPSVSEDKADRADNYHNTKEQRNEPYRSSIQAFIISLVLYL